MAEEDINKENELLPENGVVYGTILPSHNPDDWEVYRTDVDLCFKFFFNPITWGRFYIFMDSLNGYGFRLGPVYLVINVHKLIRFKNKEE